MNTVSEGLLTAELVIIGLCVFFCVCLALLVRFVRSYIKGKKKQSD